MRRIHRILLLAALVAAAPVLSGCEDLDLDKLDVFNLNQKKKLPGERKDVFPGGVPGVSQGIPPEYMIGNRQQPEIVQTPEQAPANAAASAQPEPKTAAVEPAAEPKPKVKPKPKKPRTATNAPGQVTVQRPPQQQQDQQMAPWPDQQPAQGQATAPWPSAPPPGTFSR